MKRFNIVRGSGVMTLWILFLLYHPAGAQSPYTGTWSGKFMNDFTTIILLDCDNPGSYKGKILMYAGEERIQDDVLDAISVNDDELTFRIPDKQTDFCGRFNENHLECSGHFVFPDQSQHPLTLVKRPDESSVDHSPGDQSREKGDLQKWKNSLHADSLKSDLEFLIHKLRSLHPKLYSYTSQEDFEKRCARARLALETALIADQQLSREGFLLLAAALVESVKCSHTGIRLPPEYKQSLEHRDCYFPFRVWTKDEQMFLLSSCCQEDKSPDPGVEILSVNQRPAEEIIQALLDLIPAEGGCLSAKYWELNQHFQNWFYLLDPSRSFLVEFRHQGQVKKAEFPAGSFQECVSATGPEPPAFSTDLRMSSAGKVAVLKVSSFGIRNMEAYFEHLDHFFKTVKEEQVAHLIIDLRDNPGGHPIFAVQLLSYLVDHDFTYFRNNPDVSEFEPLYRPMPANENHYRGQSYVLLNGGCQSTTGHLLALIKYHTPALFIGEQPGSSFSCNDFSLQLTLPHSGLELNIPRSTFISAVEGFEKGRDFPIDHRVETSIMDQLDKEDSYLSYTFRLINQSSGWSH